MLEPSSGQPVGVSAAGETIEPTGAAFEPANVVKHYNTNKGRISSRYVEIILNDF